MTQTGRITRQGVRDLNPRGYNGKPPSCAHFKNPELPTYVVEEVRLVAVKLPGGTLYKDKLVGVHKCSLCGADRFSEHEEE